MQFSTAITCIATLLLLGLGLVFRAACLCILLRFFQPGFLFGCRSGGPISIYTRLIFSSSTFFLSFLLLLFLKTRSFFLLGLSLLQRLLLSLNALLFLKAYAIKLILFLLRLLFEDVSFDVSTLLANFDIDGMRTTLRTGQTKFRL